MSRYTIPVPKSFLNIVGETCTVFAWGSHHYDNLYAVKKMQVKIENNTFCQNRISARVPNYFTGEKQMCGTPFRSTQRLTQVTKMMVFLSS